MSTSPTASPANACGTARPLRLVAASTTPRTAMAKVRGFGTRRERRSTTALAAPQPATTHATTASDIRGNNGGPQDVGDGLPELGHREDGAHGNQCHEQGVLEKVLPLVCPSEVDDERDEGFHGQALESGAPRRRAPRGSPLFQVDYATAANESEMAWKMLFTLVPVEVTASTATSAMRPTSSAYSSRSCPESSFTNARIRAIRSMTFLLARPSDAQ